MKYNFDQLAQRKNTNCVKYDAHKTTLPMWVADMDFLLAPKISKAIQKDLDVGAIGYSMVPPAFFDAFVNFYHERFNTNFTRGQMVYVSGVVASIDSMFRLLTNEGDNVVMLSPIYHTFYNCIKNNKCHSLTSELVLKDGQYYVDWEDLEKKLSDEKSHILLLCNPHNPVGKIFSEEELKRIDELAIKHNVLVISDEIHGLLTTPGKKYVPYSNVAKGKYVVCTATSKAFNLAGLQSAVIICPDEELRNELQDVFYADDIGEPNFFAVNANIAAFESGDWLDELNEYILKNKIYFKDYINDHIPEVEVIFTDATYMMWVDVRRLTDDSRKFVNELNEKTGLLVSPGAQFGNGGEGFFRINLATSLSNVKDACQRLEKFVKENF